MQTLYKMKATNQMTITCMILAGCDLSPRPDSADLHINDEDYARAEALLSHHLRYKVRNEKVDAHWFGTEDNFWYRRDGESVSEYVVVNAATGKMRPAFDRERLADAIGLLLETEVSSISRLRVKSRLQNT